MLHNATLDDADLATPELAPTAADLKRFVLSWLFRGEPLGVNGAVRRRFYVRRHKMWEYSKGLALTRASRPARSVGGLAASGALHVLDVGGAMTLPVFYLASLGDRVVTLDISAPMIEQTRRIAANRGLPIDARTTNLGEANPTAQSLGAPPHGFDRVYCFCVIEHVPAEAQARLAARMAGLLRPGGEMCLTFDFGEHAPPEAPLHSMAHVAAIQKAIGLPLLGNAEFTDLGTRFPLNRRHPSATYTFGSLFFKKPT